MVQSVHVSAVGEQYSYSAKNLVDDVNITGEQVQDPCGLRSTGVISGISPSTIIPSSRCYFKEAQRRLHDRLQHLSSKIRQPSLSARLDKRTESCRYLELLKEHNTKISNADIAANMIDIKLKNP